MFTGPSYKNNYANNISFKHVLYESRLRSVIISKIKQKIVFKISRCLDMARCCPSSDLKIS